MELLGILCVLLLAVGVQSIRSCKEGTTSEVEIRPRDGFFTLVNRGFKNPAEAEYDRQMQLLPCAAENYPIVNIDNGNNPMSTESHRRPEWSEAGSISQAGTSDQEVGVTVANFDASQVVTFDEKPVMDQERVVEISATSGVEKREVPAFVIVRNPQTDQDADNQQMVTINIDMLNSLIKGSLYPPSAPSRDHNWVVASLPEQIHRPSADQLLVLRVVPSDDGIADALPGFQEVADGTYRIKD